MEKVKPGRTQFSLAEAAAMIGATPSKLTTLVRHGIITPKRNEEETRWLWDQNDLLKAVVVLDISGEGEFTVDATNLNLSEPDTQERFSMLMQSDRWSQIVTSAQNLGISLEL